MFTKQVIQHAIWSRQRHNGFPIASRSVPVNFSLGLRSSLVGYSLVYRRPIENRTRNKQKTNERATNIDRDADEKLSATRRVATVMAGRIPFCNHKPAYCPSPYSCRGRQQHYSPTQDILTANQAFSTHSAHHKNPSQALKTHRRHTDQQPSKTHPTRPKHPLTSTKTQPFTAPTVGQIPRFRKAREQS